MGIGQHAHAGQVQLTFTFQGLTPATRHVGDGFRGTGQGAVQGVLGAAMDDALGFDTLPAAEAGAFHQHGRKTLATQACIQPEAGDACADNQNVGGNNGWHERPQCSRRGRSIQTRCRGNLLAINLWEQSLLAIQATRFL